jgi:Zn finger protein HypA/HybF involved in hydrogenase expression
MHESSLTEDLFEHAMIHVKEANAQRITRVKVTIGALSESRIATFFTLTVQKLKNGSHSTARQKY